MDAKLTEYYENRFAMFATKGWEDLMEDIDLMISSTNDLTSIGSEKELHFKRGELSIMKWLKGIKDSTSHAYEGLKDEGFI